MKILLLDEGQHQSLYLSRRLQECAALNPDIHVAVDVEIASSNHRRQKMSSYFPVQSHPAPKPDEPGYVDCIQSLANDVDYIIPVSNNCLPIAYNPKTSWHNKVFPPLATETFNLLFDKFASTTLAIQLGINCPETIETNTLDDINRAAEQLGLPIVLKLRDGWAGAGVRICNSIEELKKNFQMFHAQGHKNIFCQRYIHGTPCLAGGLFLDGEAIRIYCADYGFSFPPITGSSKSLISRDDADMHNNLLKFCKAVRWTGLGNLDFVRGEDGKLYFLEMNPRIWGSIAATENSATENFESDMINPLLEILQGKSPEPNLNYQANINSALFPQYVLTLCQQGGYANLWRVISDKWLWKNAPWNNVGYMFGYCIKITHAWLHGLKRTLRHSLQLSNTEESRN